MNPQTGEPVMCPDCHEPYVEPHDVQRCKTITRAWALETANMGDETSYQIVTLVSWLRDHPDERTARQISAREDRQAFLDHYVALARKGWRL